MAVMSDDFDWRSASITVTDEDGKQKEVGELTDVSIPMDLETADMADRIARDAAETFAKSLVDEAATTTHPPVFNTDSIRDAVWELEREGYIISDDPEADGERGVAAAHPSVYHDLIDDLAESIRFPASEPNSGVGVYAVDVYLDASLPEDTAIVIHPDVVVPTPPSASAGMDIESAGARDMFRVSTPRPWNVRDPYGLVAIGVDD